MLTLLWNAHVGSALNRPGQMLYSTFAVVRIKSGFAISNNTTTRSGSRDVLQPLLPRVRTLAAELDFVFSVMHARDSVR